MTARYALSIRPGSAYHIAMPGGDTTLCSLPLVIFGRPLRDDEMPLHRLCRNCAKVQAQVDRWRESAEARSA
jgi:hypothetical protein